MSLKRITLKLARCHDYPDGSIHHGYEFVAPLDETGHLDFGGWEHHRNECTVRRFWPEEPDEEGHLVFHGGHRWAFHYDDVPLEDEDDEEPLFAFDTHTFRMGDYISVTEHDGIMRTFRITDVAPVLAGS